MAGISATPTFNGSSTYASQLQETITRAVTIASLPITQLQNSESTLTGRQSELQTIDNSFAAMQTAVNNLNSSTGTGAFSAAVSNTGIASASISQGILAGSYTLDIGSTGSQTNSISLDGLTPVSDPSTTNIDSGSTYQLSVNGTTYNISDTAGTLSGLAQAINSSSAQVQASIVNVGSSSAPDYRLSIQSLAYAPDTIQLSDGSTDLLKTLSTGSNVTYQVNGQPSTPISSNSRTVTVSPGLTVQILGTGSTQVTVSQSATNLANALSAFASAYNSITAELNKNRGQNGGALTGDSVIYDLQSQLQALANYSSTGASSINTLADLGLSFDSAGSLSFDSSAFAKAASSSANDLLNFIGTSSSGGFLTAATNMLTAVTDPNSGSLAASSNSITSQLSAINTKISDDQARVAQLQTNLTQQMASADSAISSLQSQLNEVTSLFAQMQTNQRAISGY